MDGLHTDLSEVRMEVFMLGRHWGTASGWDAVDELACIFYDFRPATSVALPMGSLAFVLEKGTWEVYDDETGAVVNYGDLIALAAEMEAPHAPDVA